MPSAPAPDSNGYLILQADDLTWHRVWLIADEGIRLSVEQDAVSDPGTREYIVLEVADATKHRVGLVFDDDEVYRLTVEQDASAEDADYTISEPLLLGLNPTDGFRYAVTVIDDEGYRLAVDDTPIEVEEPAPAGETAGIIIGLHPRKPIKRKPIAVRIHVIGGEAQAAGGEVIVTTGTRLEVTGAVAMMELGQVRVRCGVRMPITGATITATGTPPTVRAVRNPTEEELVAVLTLLE